MEVFTWSIARKDNFCLLTRCRGPGVSISASSWGRFAVGDGDARKWKGYPGVIGAAEEYSHSSPL